MNRTSRQRLLAALSLVAVLLVALATFGGEGVGAADRSVNLIPGNQTPVPVKYVDNGDGTYSLAVVSQGTVTPTPTITRTPTPTITGTPPTSTPTNTPTNTATATPGLILTTVATYTLPTGTPVAYAVNDAISNSTSAPAVLTFAGMCRTAGGTGYITKARFVTDQSTNVAQYRLHVYHTPPTPIADNAAFTTLWANRDRRVGHIDLGPLGTEGSGSDSAYGSDSTLRIPYVCDAGSTSLTAILETKTVFTPAVAENFFIELTASVNAIVALFGVQAVLTYGLAA